jgi:hypothetical protein
MKLVFPLTINAVAPGAREIVIPETTIEPPTVSNLDPIRYAVLVPGSGSNVRSPIVKGGAVICGGTGLVKVDVTPLITMNDAECASDKVVLDTVISGPPGTSV